MQVSKQLSTSALNFLILLFITAEQIYAASAAYPNEPNGYQIIAESPVDAMPTTNGAGNTPAGWTGLWYRQTSSNYWLANEADAPHSPQSVFVSRFQDGLAGGSSPGLNALQGWSNRPLSSSSNQYQSVYYTFWVRINGTQFYMNNNGMKFSYFGFGRSPGSTASNEGILILEGGGSQHFYGSSFKIHYYTYHDGATIPQNANTQKLMTVGSWHQVELLQTLNTPGQSNGILRVWIDGTLAIDRSNIVYLINGNNAGFYSWKWEPTWGGGLTAHIGTDYMEIDHVYLSGIPLGGGGAVCGNGAIETGEQCDGSNLNGATCVSRGFTGGTLSCHATTCQYVTSACTSADATNPTVTFTAPASGATVSGSIVLSATATDNIGVQSVQFRVDGINQGSADTAAPYSTIWDTTAATNAPHTLTAIATDTSGNTASATRTVAVNNVVAPQCGNNIIEGTESCDGTLLGGATCSSLGFAGGSLSCSPTCQYVTSACTNGTSDTTPPTITITSPSNTVSYFVGAAIPFTIITNEPATCHRSTTDAAYSAMTGTFTTTDNITHTSQVVINSAGTFNRYARCQDAVGNTMTTSATATFQVSTTPPPRTGDLNLDGIVNILDVQRVVGKLGTAATTGEDINTDGTVNIFDLVTIAQNWG